MSWMRKMERKFGRYAIPGLMRYVIILYIAGFLIGLFAPEFYNDGSSTVESLINAHKPQKCGVFLSNFIYFYVACVACLWYNGLEVMMLETIF